MWISAGTVKQPMYIPVHTVKDSLPQQFLHSLLAYHCITGCDTVSRLYGIGKRAAWKILMDNQYKLVTFGAHGEDCDIESQLQLAEEFVIKLYNPKSDYTCIDSLRVAMFPKS